ncbi:DUF3244 domain-containing protein [Prevotella lacticifex]|nr:DUF3244 domain-containing protein [Prevotella lacticifex]
MKKLLILLLVFVTFIPSYAFGIDIRKEGTTHHGGMRMPSITRVSADYENGLITVDVKGYTGGIQVLVSDSQGNIVSSTMSSITNSGVVSLDLGALAEGDYTLYIVLGNTTYSGEFTL